MQLDPIATTDSPYAEADFTSRELFASSDLSITLDHCLRQGHSVSDEESWGEHVLIFPLSGVNLMHVESDSFVVDPSQVTLMNRGDVYRVSHPHGSGEAAINIVVRESALFEILARCNLLEESERPFSRSQVPNSPELYLDVLQVLSNGEPMTLDALGTEESALNLVGAVAQALAALENVAQAHDSSEDDRDLACSTATILAARYTEPLSLDQIARALPVAKFRLCRVFKRATGETIWQRLQQLRARAAATELAAGARDLSRLAFALGFSSHSHFTASFRRVFGITPSALRARHFRGSPTRVTSFSVVCHYSAHDHAARRE